MEIVRRSSKNSRSNTSPSSADLCPELGTTLQVVVAVGNRYPWANPSSGGTAVRRDKLLHLLCFAEIQAAKSWVLPNRVQGLSFCFSFQPKFNLTDPAIENGFEQSIRQC